MTQDNPRSFILSKLSPGSSGEEERGGGGGGGAGGAPKLLVGLCEWYTETSSSTFLLIL